MIQSIDPPQTPHPQPLQPQSRVPETCAPMVYVYEQQRWEYRVLARRAAEAAPSETELNALGKDGWELVGVAQISDEAQFYFKRPRR